MSTVIENTQKYIEKIVQDLSGDEDFLPFMTIKNHKDDIIFVGLMMPDGPEEKDEIADMMTALCMVHRGVEVAFASTCWMVTAVSGGALTETVPSRHPDRVEAVVLSVLDAENRPATYTAHLIRENNMVGVGLWSTKLDTDAGGRFERAIRAGVALGRKLPPDMCEYLDAEQDAGRLEEIVQKTARMIREARKESDR